MIEEASATHHCTYSMTAFRDQTVVREILGQLYMAILELVFACLSTWKYVGITSFKRNKYTRH